MASRRAQVKGTSLRRVFAAKAIIPPNTMIEDGTVNVERMIERRSRQDLLDMGLWMEQWLQSPAGQLVCHLLDRLELNAVYDSKQPTVNAHLTLGQIQAYHAVRNAIEGVIKDRYEMQRQIAEAAREPATEEA